MHRPIALFALLVMAAACDDTAGEPPVRPDDPLATCHPFAHADTSPAVSLRAAAPPTDAVAWAPPPLPPYEGPLAPNDALVSAERYGEAVLTRAEDIAFGADGRLYTGNDDAEGSIWRAPIDRDGRVGELARFATVGGHPLGLDFDPCGNLIAAVPNMGIVAVSPAGEVRLLADRVDGTLIEFADELVVAHDGTIYVTEASTKYERAWPYEILEGRPHGRLLAYEPATGRVRVLVNEDLYFPNGVVLSDDESHLLFAETLRGRVRRLWLNGAKAGTVEPFIENLPVLPDNISYDRRGNLWITGPQRTLQNDQLSASLEARMALLARPLEELLTIAPTPPYALVVVVDARGRITHSLHDATGQGLPLSSAIVRRQSLYLGTNAGRGIARVTLDEGAL